ncbi:phage tail spike protein [Bittarella massiliensis (ex Durand et al. 2017)]|uniref:phage tail spike protein n=1 Tax=Bittarella massiliensis (ex Durand et al. 2017) TaxID=1720313 RepID=UPI00073EA371|nr:phage tail spike protein [Bittarella massiliensis (ex Durand et al. 2017)]
MIPVLFAPGETAFESDGLGLLPDCLSCEVTEERNGIFEASIQYPTTGRHYADIENGSIVKLLPNDTSDPQLFRVYKISAPINQVVTLSLEHISYELGDTPVIRFQASGNAGTALTTLLRAAVVPHRFTAWSDITSSNSTEIKEPCSVRACLGGKEGSILDVWGGEYEWDNFEVKLHAHRGQQTEVVLEYGKNIADLTQEQNIGEMVTALLPYVKQTVDGSDVYTILPEQYLEAPTADKFPRLRVGVRDFTGDFSEGEPVTVDALRAKAQAYIKSANIGVPLVNIKVAFEPLWQTEGNEALRPLQKVGLGDTLTVRFPALGVDATAKVIKTIYDPLAEKYTSIELGDAKSNLADTIGGVQNSVHEIEKTVSGVDSLIEAEVNRATDILTGTDGGHVVIKRDDARKPQEILIMDTEDMATARKVWRWNMGGFGYSSNGINGPYDTAITMDGHIVGKFITAYTIIGSQIIAGRIQSKDGTIYFDLDSGDAAVKKLIGAGGYQVDVGGFNGSDGSQLYGIRLNNAEGVPLIKMGGYSVAAEHAFLSAPRSFGIDFGGETEKYSAHLYSSYGWALGDPTEEHSCAIHMRIDDSPASFELRRNRILISSSPVGGGRASGIEIDETGVNIYGPKVTVNGREI